MELLELLALFEDRLQPAKAALIEGHLTRDQRTAVFACLMPAEDMATMIRQRFPTNGSDPRKPEGA